MAGRPRSRSTCGRLCVFQLLQNDHTIHKSFLLLVVSMAVETNGGAKSDTLRQRKVGDKNGDVAYTTNEGKKVDALLDQHGS
jgi:hypothetical protein